MRSTALAALGMLSISCAHREPIAVAPMTSVQRQVMNAVDSGDGDYQIHTLRASVDADPLDLKSRLALARRYQQLGFPDVAIEHCKLACERAPDSEEAHIALAKMLRDEVRADEGERVLTRFATQHEAGAQVWAWIGLLRDDSGEWKSGEAAHRKAVALAPDHDELHNNLGYCLLRQGRKAEAQVEFQTALRLNGASAVARNNLGSLLTSKPKEAVENLQSVTDPASAHNNLAVAYIEARQYAEARGEIEIALGYNRHHSAALMNLELVSQMDQKPAEFRPRSDGMWVTVRTRWRRFWGSDNATDSGQANQSGTPVASR